jgi:glutamate racemase
VDKEKMKSGDSRPIGIFDSGMGGLTVFNEVKKSLPNEDIIYFGDTAHLPYGNKSPESVTEFSLRIRDFFKEKKVKLMLVACNTASVYAIEKLQKSSDIPVLGVVDAGVRAALKYEPESCGIIGTYGTIKSGSYEKKLNNASGSKLRLLSKACPLFVPLVEEGWLDNDITRAVAHRYLDIFKDKIDLLILGCTHYPLLIDIISEVVGKKVRVINSAVEIAAQVRRETENLNLGAAKKGSASYKFYVSDSPELFKEQSTIFMNGTDGKIKKKDLNS